MVQFHAIRVLCIPTQIPMSWIPSAFFLLNIEYLNYSFTQYSVDTVKKSENIEVILSSDVVMGCSLRILNLLNR